MRQRKPRPAHDAGRELLRRQLPLLLLFIFIACVIFYNYSNFQQRAKPIHAASRHSWEDSLDAQEYNSSRCKNSGICWKQGCGEDGLGCLMQDEQRRAKIVQAIRWSWLGYKRSAWGRDTLLPLKRKGQKWMDLGLTIVDSLDTLLVAGLQEEFKDARQWVLQNLDFENTTAVSVFETNIRVLGGLLSAYYWNDKDKMFLEKAVALAERMMPAFKTPHGLAMPYLDLVWGAVPEHKPKWMKIREGTTTLADAGSFALEFSTVSYLTGRPKYGEAAMNIQHILETTSGDEGLHCNAMFLHTLMCASTDRGVGGGADSAYEYMLKQWLLSGKRDTTSLKLYKRAMAAVREQLLDEAETSVGRLTYVGVVDMSRGFLPTMEHLACFLPGLLALGHYHGVNTATHRSDDDDLTLAKKLMHTCNQMYAQSVTGLAPEEVVIGPHTLTAYGRRARPLHTPWRRFDNGLPVRTSTVVPGAASLDDHIRASIPNVQDLDVVDMVLLHKWWRSTLGLNTTRQQLEQMLESGELGWMSGEHKRRMGEVLSKPVSGEGVYWTSKHEILLRPETVESVYILYKVTKDEQYKHMGWQIFRAFNRFCNVTSGGFATLERGDILPPWRQMSAQMPSYWLAETLKYLYLMFDESASKRWSLEKVVFSTEAHPLRVQTRSWRDPGQSQL